MAKVYKNLTHSRGNGIEREGITVQIKDGVLSIIFEEGCTSKAIIFLIESIEEPEKDTLILRRSDSSYFHKFRFPSQLSKIRFMRDIDEARKGSQTARYFDGDLIAIVNPDKCKPEICQLECKNSCPVVRVGRNCIDVAPNDKIAKISEELCTACTVCYRACPFKAIKIVDRIKNLKKDTTHQYAQNSFRLQCLPAPTPGKVLGFVGANGIGKSTALKILAGKQMPNLGRYSNPPDWTEILNYFHGSELQNYFTNIIEDDLKALMKPQYVHQIGNSVRGTVQQLLDAKDEKANLEEICKKLDLLNIRNRAVETLSGGELQRFACAMVCIQDGDIYVFDEPSSYLDVKQRLNTAVTIRSLIHPEKFIIVADHDLSVLDYLSDFICYLYGIPGVYGVVSMPFSVREGINIFLDGAIPTENLRYHYKSLVFRFGKSVEKCGNLYEYPQMSKSLGSFHLSVQKGQFSDSEILVLLGENATGKTTFLRMLAGEIEPDEGAAYIPNVNTSYKPRNVSLKTQGIVRNLFTENDHIEEYDDFFSSIGYPLGMIELNNKEVQSLSGGEMQIVSLALALAKPADIYLIDEPLAYLDSKQRVRTAQAIKRYIRKSKKTAFIVEHDFMMATYLADKVILFEGTPSVHTTAHAPQNLLAGVNRFLEMLGITFRTGKKRRPRVNKINSVEDIQQKRDGQYFFIQD